MRFELTTPTLARLCSTPELRPLERLTLSISAVYMRQHFFECNRKIRDNCQRGLTYFCSDVGGVFKIRNVV